MMEQVGQCQGSPKKEDTCRNKSMARGQVLVLVVAVVAVAVHRVVAWTTPPIPPMQQQRRRSPLRMSFADGKANFLVDKSQELYLANLLRRASDGTKQLLKDGSKLVEVEFPANRKNDLSLAETQDTNLQFAMDFVTIFENEKKNLWVVLPDKNEVYRARPRFGESLPFTLTSIGGLMDAKPDVQPTLMVVVSPGFNIDEYINLVKVVAQAGMPPVVVINGNLDRLRNGYYPGIFYPGLARVSKEFYSRAEQALYLSPIAVGGVRFGAWLARAAPGPWEVLVRGPNGYDVVQSTDKEPPAKNAWALAKKAFQERNGGGMF